MFRIFRSANSAQDAESERIEVLDGSTAGAPKCPAPARAAVAASMTHRKQSVPLPLSPIRARCSLKPVRNQVTVKVPKAPESSLPILLVFTAALWRAKQHPLARKYMKIPSMQGIIHQLQVVSEILQCCRVLAFLDYYMHSKHCRNPTSYLGCLFLNHAHLQWLGESSSTGLISPD